MGNAETREISDLNAIASLPQQIAVILIFTSILAKQLRIRKKDMAFANIQNVLLSMNKLGNPKIAFSLSSN